MWSRRRPSVTIVLAMLSAVATPADAKMPGSGSGAAPADAAASLRFANDIMATRAGDQRLYVLLGSGFFRPFTTTTGSAKALVTDWLRRHPDATVTPVSRLLSTNTISHVQSEIVYIWIEDGSASLNVELIASGSFLGATMFDMVDNRKGLDELLKHDSKLAGAREEIEKERAATPQDRDERLVPDDVYTAHLARFAAAEREARAQRRGIWSTAMAEERRAEGVR